MTTLKELSDEHLEVMQKAELLVPIVGRIVMGQALEAMQPLGDICTFIRRAILPHFELEETDIFPFLLRGNQEDKKIYEELMEEHHLLRKDFACFTELCQWEELGDEFIRIFTEMITRLLAHDKIEDIILIPLIRRMLAIDDDEPIPHAPSLLYSDS